MSLLCVGSIALDTIETPHGIRKDVLGGSCVYFALAAKQFSSTTRVVGIVGEDFPHLERIKSSGIDTRGVKISTGKTFRWHGKYIGDMSTRVTLSCELGTFADFAPEVPQELRDSKFVLLGNCSPKTQAYVLSQLKSPSFVMLDTMDFWIKGANKELTSLMERVDAICINSEEAMMLSKTSSLSKATSELTKRVKCVIIKKAHEGAMVATRESEFSLPAFRTKQVVDPTGAGDSFAGGFLGALSAGKTHPEFKLALAYACAMGSFAVEDFGPGRLENITRQEIDSRAQSLFSHS